MSRKKKENQPCRAFIETPALLAEAVVQDGFPMFAVYDRFDGTFAYQAEFDMGLPGKNERYRPLLPDDGLIGFVAFPSAVEEYGTEADLFEAIRLFIRRWCDLSERYEKIAALYVMFTWCHDEFFEIPYLRIIADLGSGKSRLGVHVLGSVCYKAFKTVAASTLSPIFRTLDFLGGTMVLDEADLGDKSDKTSELVQVLNSGYMRGLCVMRSEKAGDGFSVAKYKVFGPKVIISREHFKDAALESRCVELCIERTVRTDIPFFIDETLEEGAQAIRNRLLLWRFRTRGTHRAKIDRSFETVDIPPRLKQLLLVLSGTVSDKSLVSVLRELGHQLSEEHAERRGATFEGEIVSSLAARGAGVFISCQEVAEELNAEAEAKEKKSPRSIGWYMRERLGLKPRRQGKTRRFGVNLSDDELRNLTQTYGIPYESRKESAGGNISHVGVQAGDSDGNGVPF